MEQMQDAEALLNLMFMTGKLMSTERLRMTKN